MKKRALLICLAVLVCLSGIGVRIWYVNQERKDSVKKIYSMGEMVPYEDDFFYRSDEIRDMYEIGVLSAKIMTTEKYLQELGVTKEDVWGEMEAPKLIIDVEVRVRNKDTSTENNEQGIDCLNTILISGGDYFQMDHELLYTLYPQIEQQGNAGFRLRNNTEMVMHFPYSDGYLSLTNIERIKGQDLYMLLSMYPTKKMIKIELE